VIWWVTGALERLSKEGRFALERQQDTPAGGGLLVSAISCWEVAMLVQRGRLALNMEVERWLALVATRLPEPFHPDPVDRFLVAQAHHLEIPLLSADSKILAYPHVRGLW